MCCKRNSDATPFGSRTSDACHAGSEASPSCQRIIWCNSRPEPDWPLAMSKLYTLRQNREDSTWPSITANTNSSERRWPSVATITIGAGRAFCAGGDESLGRAGIVQAIGSRKTLAGVASGAAACDFAEIPNRSRTEGPVAGGATASQRFERTVWEAVKWIGQQELGRKPASAIIWRLSGLFLRGFARAWP